MVVETSAGLEMALCCCCYIFFLEEVSLKLKAVRLTPHTVHQSGSGGNGEHSAGKRGGAGGEGGGGRADQGRRGRPRPHRRPGMFPNPCERPRATLHKTICCRRERQPIWREIGGGGSGGEAYGGGEVAASAIYYVGNIRIVPTI